MTYPLHPQRVIERSLFDFVFEGDFSIAEQGYLQNPDFIAAAQRNVFAQKRIFLIGVGYHSSDLESEEDIISTLIKHEIVNSTIAGIFVVSEEECRKTVPESIECLFTA